MSPQPLSLDSHDQEEVTSSGVESPYGYNNQQRPQGQDDDDGPVYKEEVKVLSQPRKYDLLFASKQICVIIT